MSSNKKEKLDDNRAANLITDLNLELKLFLDKFSYFRREYNITDINLLNNLDLVYDEINTFISGNPVHYKTEERTNVDLKAIKDNKILRVFVCDSCQVEVGERSRDVIKHIEYFPSHIRNRSTKGGNAKDYSVIENGVINGENARALARQEARKKKKEEKKQKLADKVNISKKAKTFISGDFGVFLDRAFRDGKKLMEIPEYKKVEKSLNDVLKRNYPNTKVYFFGSRINGLSNPNSDLDVFLDLDNTYHHYQRNANQDKKIGKIEGLLRKSVDWKPFTSVRKARVPILKAYFVVDGFHINCDISFSHGLGHLNTLLTKYFFELQPICHKMCLFLKEWIKLTNIQNMVSTYAFVLLTVFYLQTKNLLPSVKTLQDGIKEPIEIGPWQGDFAEKSLSELKIEKVDSSNKVCYQYLKDFFEFYFKFDFNKEIVCPYLGRSISKSTLHSTDLDSIPRYKTYYLKDPKEHSFQISKPICVMDPLELNHNVTKGVTDLTLKTIKKYWAGTYEELTKRN